MLFVVSMSLDKKIFLKKKRKDRTLLVYFAAVYLLIQMP